MNLDQKIYEFLVAHHLGVLATLHPNGKPEAAVVHVTVTDSLKIIFDCLPDSRKSENLRQNNHVAMVVGWDKNITVQIEGKARYY